mgnify:CR=1 FL=1|tara:strand:+ start:257 stop:544 length:288 start_codon:yes stop_codon:yes gene_type:complete
MPTINVIKSFQWSPDGKEVIDYAPGTHDVPERCAVVAVEHLEAATLLTDDEKKKLEAEAQAKAAAEAKAAEEAAAQANAQQPPPPTKATKTTTKK